MLNTDIKTTDLDQARRLILAEIYLFLLRKRTERETDQAQAQAHNDPQEA